MADFSRDPREHWLKPRFSKNEVANSGNVMEFFLALDGYGSAENVTDDGTIALGL